MPSSRSGLTALFADTVVRPGRYYDLHGLYLRVSRPGERFWEQRITVAGRRRTLVLGRYLSVSLRAACEAALAHLRAVRAGQDPFDLRRRDPVPTFEAAARSVHALWAPSWCNPRTASLWIHSLEMHVFPAIGAKLVSEVGFSDIVDVLIPLRSTPPNTARSVRQRIGRVMLWAVAEDHCAGNPGGAPLTAFWVRSRAAPCITLPCLLPRWALPLHASVRFPVFPLRAWRHSLVAYVSVLRRAYVARTNSSSATAPSGFRLGSRWMIDEIWASGLAEPNWSTDSARMNWSADIPSQAVRAAKLLTSG